MYVQVKSSGGITLVPLESRLLAQRVIWLEDEITPQTASDFSKQMQLLNWEDPHRPIDVLINSPGGEINSGLAIYDVIQTSEAPVRLFCMGRAYSMAAVLFASGRHGRYMLPHSELMLHEPLLGNRVGGSSSTIRSISESLMETRKKLNQILAKHTGRTEKEVEEATGYDHYFSAEESIAFGLCDSIQGFHKIVDSMGGAPWKD